MVIKSNFFMLIGISGSGKSTYAKQLSQEQNAIIVSSDSIRKELWGDENIQGNPLEVFNLVHKRVIENLRLGNNIICDATSLSIKDRASLLNKLTNINCFKTVIVIATPIEVCIEQDNQRERKVGREVIERQIRKFEIPFSGEGFDEIKIVNPTEKYENLQELISKTVGYNQNSHWHKYTLNVHMGEVAYEIIKHSNKCHLRMAALLHDICKIQSQIIKPNGEYGFYNHANMGCYYLMCCNKCKEWVWTDYQEYLDFLFIVCYHMKMMETNKLETLEKYKKLFGEEKFNDLVLFSKCDRIGSGYEGDK